MRTQSRLARMASFGALSAALLVALAAPAPAQAAGSIYRPQAIKTNGIQFTPARAGNPFSANGRLVAGTSTSAAVTQAAIYDVRTQRVRLLGAVVGMDSQALDVNNQGNAIGYTTVGGASRPFFVPNHSSVFRSIDPTGARRATVAAINNSDIVVGTMFDAKGVRRAFRWDRMVRTFDRVDRPFDDVGTLGVGINTAGFILSQADDSLAPEALVWDPVTKQVISAGSYPADISDQGLVVGQRLAHFDMFGYTYSIVTKKYTELMTDDLARTTADKVGPHGEVAGTLEGSALFWTDCGGEQKSLIFGNVRAGWLVYGIDITGALWAGDGDGKVERWVRSPGCT